MFDRKQWPAGPWDDEPDSFAFEHAGFKCKGERNNHGVWCGYVLVPNDHPIRYAGEGELDALECHGGVTWSRDDGDGDFWVGFDCGHAWDFSPGMAAQMPSHVLLPGEKYRDLAYVKQNCRSMAEQLNLKTKASRAACRLGGLAVAREVEELDD